MEFLDYKKWLIAESQMRGISDWTEVDMAEWQKLHLENLGKLGEVFAKTRTPWWIDAGTLLGIYRDGALIKGDSDSDIGMKVENFDMDFLQSVEKCWDPGTESPMFYGYKEACEAVEDDAYRAAKGIKFCGLRNKRGSVLTYKGKEIWCDVFVYCPHKKDRIYRFADGYFRTKNSLIEKFDAFTFQGISLKRPQKPDDYLELTYGKSWKTPNPQWADDEGDLYGGPIDLGGTYKWNFKKQDYQID